jgi:hypothetical protein
MSAGVLVIPSYIGLCFYLQLFHLSKFLLTWSDTAQSNGHGHGLCMAVVDPGFGPDWKARLGPVMTDQVLTPVEQPQQPPAVPNTLKLLMVQICTADGATLDHRYPPQEAAPGLLLPCVPQHVNSQSAGCARCQQRLTGSSGQL